MKILIGVAGCLLVAAGLWVGCNGGVGRGGKFDNGVGNSLATVFAVFNDTISNNVGVAGITTTGALNPVSGGQFVAGSQPSQIATTPNGKIVYVVNRGSNSINSFSISSIGQLISLGPSLATGANPSSIAVDGSARFLVVGNQDANTVSIFNIAADGTLAQSPSSPLNVGISPISVTSQGNFTFVASTTAVVGLAFNAATGSFTVTTGSPVTVGSVGTVVSAIRLSNVGKNLYITDSGNNRVLVYSVDQTTGALTAAGSATTGTQPVALVPDSAEQFLYVANQGSNDIGGYTIDPLTGNLTAMTGSPFPTASGPTALAFDGVHGVLLAVNSGSRQISTYTVTPGTGVLTPVAGSPFAAGSAPTTVAVATP